MKRILCAVALAAMLSACGDPVIDGSSPEAYRKSLTEVRESLPEAERAAFEEAFSTVLMKDGAFALLDSSVDGMQAKAAERVGGKTAKQIIDEAAAIVAERQAKEREQALAEIVELRAKRDRGLEAAEKLKAFKVERSRLVFRDQMFGRPQPVIELVVVNGTGSAVSRAYFRGTVASPGRAVPWIREVFNYQIPGGLEPNERAEWNLQPNMFSDWAREIPDDAVMTVEVTRLDGADEKALYDAEGLSEREARRLEELEKKFGA